MFIQTEETPNPLTLKFLPNQPVMEEGTAHFASVEDAKRSPLVERLFQINGVVGILLGNDFVAVTKTPEKEWYVLKPSILGTIMEHFVTKRSLFYSSSSKEVLCASLNLEELDAISREIKEIIEEKVRPAVALDGGDILFDRFEEGIVYLRLHGACSGCPSSTLTLKNGIENMLKHYVPEVIEVRAVMADSLG